MELGLVTATPVPGAAGTWRTLLQDPDTPLAPTPGDTGHNAEVGGLLWGLLLPHLCLGEQGTPC